MFSVILYMLRLLAIALPLALSIFFPLLLWRFPSSQLFCVHYTYICNHCYVECLNTTRLHLPCSFSPWRWGRSSTQAWMPTYVSILRIPQMIRVWRETVEWYWQGKTEELGKKPVPVPLCPPQIPHGLTRTRTRASAVRGRRLTNWALARPCRVVAHD
jgi:hypothetical protein